jgi:hypothetical protein
MVRARRLEARNADELISDYWPSAVLRQALIFGPDNGVAVDSFEPTNGEMTSRHLLKMLDEGVIDGSAANRTEHLARRHDHQNRTGLMRLRTESLLPDHGY